MYIHPALSANINKNNIIGVLVGVLALGVVGIIYAPLVPHSVLYLWLGLQLFAHALRLHAGQGLGRIRVQSHSLVFHTWYFTITMAFSGILWGITGLISEVYGSLLIQLLTLSVATGIVGGSISTISPVFPAFLAFVLPSMLLQALGFLIADASHDVARAGLYQTLVGLLILVYIGVVYRAGRTLHSSRVEALLLQQQLVDAKENAELASQAKTRFLSSVSHELRTPLHAILGFAQVINAEEQLPPVQREGVGQILQAGEHLLALINQILEFTHIQTGELRLKLETVDVTNLLGQCLPLAESIAEKHQISLLLKLPDQQVYLSTDPMRLKQILLNLISNAVKYNQPHGQVEVHCNIQDDRILRFLVADNGIGIPVDRQAELFQPFNRLGRETEAIEGAGIGLVISRELALKLGGTLDFSSQPGAGSRFWLDLPMSPYA